MENQRTKYWLAESRLTELKGDYKIINKKNGKDLEGKGYIMPYASFEDQKKSPTCLF